MFHHPNPHTPHTHTPPHTTMDASALMAAAAAAGIDPQSSLPPQQDKELSIGEEYDLWRSNVPLMYDFVSETELVWPSLTVQWLPRGNTPVSQNVQHMILGTHTSGEEPNYLKIAAITLPDEIVDTTPTPTNDHDHEYPHSNIRIVQKFRHDEEVTRARYMPQDPNIIATINGQGQVSIFDRQSDHTDAISKLHYHTRDGYGLSFNPNRRGQLLTGADDHHIALWDINKQTLIKNWESTHDDIVNDCKWNNFNSDIFASVSEDCTLKINDLRNDTIISGVKLEKSFNTIAFSKHSQFLMAAAGTDSNIYLYDMRSMDQPLHVMCGHQREVTSLEFMEQKDGILLSAGADRRAIIWNINDIGKEQIVEDSEDAAPEVVMIHAGHRGPINDISINPNIPWLMASCEEENIVQVWKCSSKLPTVGGEPDLDQDLLKQML